MNVGFGDKNSEEAAMVTVFVFVLVEQERRKQRTLTLYESLAAALAPTHHSGHDKCVGHLQLNTP